MKVVLCYAVFILLLQFTREQLLVPENGGSGVELSGSGIGHLICPGGQFFCQNSTDVCVGENVVCDGKIDCPSGEDESVCTQLACNLDQYRCASGRACIPLYQVCDGVADCIDGDDESSCAGAPGSTVALNEFVCTSTGQRIARALLCDGSGDCPNGEDEARCERPNVQMLTPTEISVQSGANITLSCGAMGYPPTFTTWQRNLAPIPRNPRYTLTSHNGYAVLHIQDAGLEDAGRYYCEVVSPLYGSYLLMDSVLVQVTDTSPSVCIAQSYVEYSEGSYYYDVRPVGIGPASQAAADIIFVVDESGSMAGEQGWIREEVQVLDRMLKEKGVGSGMRRNMFALVGYSRNNPQDILGITLTTLASSSDFVTASRNLMVTGTAEDGYAAIDYALTNIPTRSDTAKQIILVTDSDRRILQFDLNRANIEQRVRELGFTLNVVVNQGFVISEVDSIFALGITNTFGYVLDTLTKRLYSSVNSSEVTLSQYISFGSTIEDYVTLALNLDGAAWDINQLREGGTFSEAFVNAFSDIKVEEMMTVFRYCFECQCRSRREVCSLANSVALRDCSGKLPVLRSVVTPESSLVKQGTMVLFTCLVYSNSEDDPVELTWLYPPELADTLVVFGSSLIISSVMVQANVTCVVTQNGTGLSTRTSATITIDSRCELPDRSYLTLGDVRVVIVPRDVNQSRAADIILLVDESSSMADELAWIPGMAQLLDQSLILAGIGATEQNKFGVVGFGDGCDSSDSALGRVLVNDMQQMLTCAGNISGLIQNLKLGGRDEDGYSAMETALNGYAFRNAAKQFILITDEDRDVLSVNLTRDRIKTMLGDSDVQLNVVVSEQFLAGGLRALGVDGNMNAYLYDPSILSLFTVEEGSGISLENGAYGSTNIDYTSLAWELQGAAWDLSQLRQGGDVARAFTNAFVHAKVVEIRSQLDNCWNCTCGLDGPVCELLSDANFTTCMRRAGIPPRDEEPLSVMIEGEESATILPSETRSFTCVANSSGVIRWTMDGKNLPANVRVEDVGGFISRLIIDSPGPEDTGVYVCNVHSQSGFYSARDSVNIIFYDPDQDLMLQVSPSQAVVATGDSITLTCSAASPSSFSWTFDYGSLPPNAVESSSATSSTLLLVAVDQSLEGAYICTATRRDLAVLSEVSAHIQIKNAVLALHVEPDRLIVRQGDMVQVTCRVECFCPGVVPTWTRSDNATLSEMASVLHEDNEALLTISSTLVDDSGRYICSAEQQDTTVFSELYLTVTTDENFSVKVLGPTDLQVSNGSYHSLLCQTNQNARSFMWLFNNTPIQVQDEQLQNGAPENVVAIDLSTVQSIISISEVDVFNAGTYECVARAAADDQSASSQVDLSII